MNLRIVLSLVLLTISWLGRSQNTPLAIGETVTIQSESLKEKRHLNIYKPFSASESDTTRYNVIYVLDGSKHEDFLHIVGLVQFFNLQYTMPPTIVVGIENVDRKRDFTHHTDDTTYLGYLPTGGHSAAFMDFMEDEVIPYINANYAVTGERTLMGQSLGGLMASEFLLKRPGLFTEYWIVSPSLWWDDESMLKSASSLWQSHTVIPQRVFIAVGKEGWVMRRVAKKLYRALKKSKHQPANLVHHYMPKENHASILHNAIYAAMLAKYPLKTYN